MNVKITRCFQMTRNTTPMYRAPEMLDLYNNYPINEKLDIWVFVASFVQNVQIKWLLAIRRHWDASYICCVI